jgi:transcriptional regulator
VPKLEFHVARANPLGSMAEKGGTWLVAVQGHDAYVSPDWYASADQVPTWLYEACICPARCGSFPATTRRATRSG